MMIGPTTRQGCRSEAWEASKADLTSRGIGGYAPRMTMNDTKRFEQAQRDRLAELVKAVDAREPHAEYLELLLLQAELGKPLEDVRVPRGVSGLVVRALIEDVEWIIAPVPQPGTSASPYPGAYSRLMLTWARSSTARKATHAANATWAGLDFGGK